MKVLSMPYKRKGSTSLKEALPYFGRDGRKFYDVLATKALQTALKLMISILIFCNPKFSGTRQHINARR